MRLSTYCKYNPGIVKYFWVFGQFLFLPPHYEVFTVRETRHYDNTIQNKLNDPAIAKFWYISSLCLNTLYFIFNLSNRINTSQTEFKCTCQHNATSDWISQEFASVYSVIYRQSTVGYRSEITFLDATDE